MALFDTNQTTPDAEQPTATGGKTAMRCHTVRGKRIFDVRRFNYKDFPNLTPWRSK